MPYLQTVDSEILAAVFEIYGSVICYINFTFSDIIAPP